MQEGNSENSVIIKFVDEKAKEDILRFSRLYTNEYVDKKRPREFTLGYAFDRIEAYEKELRDEKETLLKRIRELEQELEKHKLENDRVKAGIAPVCHRGHFF